MTTERERMLAGESYNPRDPALLATAHRARALLAELQAAPSTDAGARRAVLERLLGSVGREVWIEAPFFCDYGENVHIGDNGFVNVNCVFLDSAEIRIGANALIGPSVQLYTAFHPLRAAERIVAGWTPASGLAPYRTRAAPIRIGDNVWLGGGTIVMPGVTIGDNVTVGAGSVVTHDLPSDVLALGQPCRVVREL